MLYNISEGYSLTPTSKGTLFSKIALRKNHNGKAFGSQLLQRRGSLRLIDLKMYLPCNTLRLPQNLGDFQMHRVGILQIIRLMMLSEPSCFCLV